MSRRELTTRERAVLDFERNWPAHAGGKLKAITTTFSFSPSRYYQLLAELLERPAAQDYDPLLVRRLRRRRQPQRPQQATPGLTDQRHQRLTK
ncbi:hypothetical protein BH24ACT15_BH24ACT15_15270 [soil metagenome]